MKRYDRHMQTHQQEALTDDQVKNSAGGYVFAVDDWTRVERFLILGSEGGTFYINERTLTRENAQAATRLLQSKENGLELVKRIVEISDSGRAVRNSPALFLLAMATAAPDRAVRKAAWSQLTKVARTGSHLFEFVRYREVFGGWGRLARQGISRWYTDRTLEDLAYQVVKYRQRDGWTHRDVVRLAHPVVTGELRVAMDMICKPHSVPLQDGFTGLSGRVQTLARLAANPNSFDAPLEAIGEYKLTREMLPTNYLTSVSVNRELLPHMPFTAMVRNLGNMTRIGVMANAPAREHVITRLADAEALKRARVHPLTLLSAMKTYAAGKGFRGKNTWVPHPKIVDALNDSVGLAMKQVEPTGKRFLYGVDVSYSMQQSCAGLDHISCAEASAVLALVAARTETNVELFAFSHEFVPLGISASSRLDDAMTKTVNRNFGGTDCALPMIHAMQHDIPVDVFVVLTDNETWYGDMHPVEALRRYRQKTGINAKLVVVSMVANRFSIADPNDAGMLDVVGMDTSVPALIADFAKH